MKRLLVSICLLLAIAPVIGQQNSFYLLAGTYTGGKSEGIYIYKFNAQRGFFSQTSRVTVADNPSYIVVSPDQQFVYAVNENKGKPGEVSAFSFDKNKGELKLLNKQPAGDAPCYITIDSSGKFIFVAEYGSGSIAVYPVNADGSLKERVQYIQHEGYGVVYERQDKSHMHSVVLSPDQRYLFAADLGTDRLYQYKFDPSNGKAPLSPAETPFYSVNDGSGPRHFIFHPNGQTAYLLNELRGEVVVFDYKNEKLQEVQTIASATAGGEYEKGSADIHISPNAKFLFTSNRGASNSITIYMISKDGKLNKTGEAKVGQHPRNFMVEPTGKFLLVASRDDNFIQMYSINPNFGLLEATDQKIQLEKPVFLTMIPAR